MINKNFRDQYCKVAIANLTQILTNSSCIATNVAPHQSKGPEALVHQEAAVGACVVIWDIHLWRAGTRQGPYVGTVRLEFGTYIDMQTNLKSLQGVEGALHQAWCGSPNGAWEGTAEALPAWCMAPQPSE